ncbi:unnamed protein product [Schistosoma mattheei]|uniref:C2H2-type domain-containing protein n=1 Tax=Schistosoma mattheei TaxID=31246 RepID=A0AA85BYR8_9TREM|nr:unnamed protein product [Schistosoma mattheei]
MNELCPFHPKHDIYAIHEQMKNKISDYDWECQMCGKRFYTENTFDLHIGNRHETNAYSTSRTICLSSYCSLLRCSVLKPVIDYGYQVFWDEALCDPKSFEAISKQCEDILNKCTPSGNDSSSTQIRQLLQTTLCDQLSCDRYWILPDSHIQTSVWEKVLTALIVTSGLLTYYSVIFMRLRFGDCPKFCNPRGLFNCEIQFSSKILADDVQYIMPCSIDLLAIKCQQNHHDT